MAANDDEETTSYNCVLPLHTLNLEALAIFQCRRARMSNIGLHCTLALSRMIARDAPKALRVAAERASSTQRT